MTETEEIKLHSMKKALEALEVVSALEVLEFHDRNYLSSPMADAAKCNQEKRRLLSVAMQSLSGHV